MVKLFLTIFLFSHAGLGCAEEKMLPVATVLYYSTFESKKGRIEHPLKKLSAEQLENIKNQGYAYIRAGFADGGELLFVESIFRGGIQWRSEYKYSEGRLINKRRFNSSGKMIESVDYGKNGEIIQPAPGIF